jgi:feruloyl esterase
LFEAFRNDLNLNPYFKRGRKLLLYQGWADTQVAPDNTIAYFKAVVSHAGDGAVGKSIQLYMVPGMDHCQGGDGTDRFDKVTAMERWLSTGGAPERIDASHVIDGHVDRTRPICAYGKTAKFNGAGSTDEAANFSCTDR